MQSEVNQEENLNRIDIINIYNRFLDCDFGYRNFDLY